MTPLIVLKITVLSYDNFVFKMKTLTLQRWHFYSEPDVGWTHFTNGLRAHKPNPAKYVLLFLKNNDHTRSQSCTCHDSSAVVTYAKLWPGWIITIIDRTKINSQDFKYELINCFWNKVRIVPALTLKGHHFRGIRVRLSCRVCILKHHQHTVDFVL